MKSVRKRWLLILTLFLYAVVVNAQELSDYNEDTALQDGVTVSNPETADTILEPSFRLSESDSGALFVQTLTWERARYAVRYTVVLERRNEATGIWAEVLRRIVSADFTHMDVSVPAGQFRYMVSSYNILDQLDNQTSWEEFTVIQALQPSIVSFFPPVFYLDRQTPRILTITGENLLPESDIYLIHKTFLDENGEPPLLIPRELHRNELGETARLIFDDEDLVAGSYEIYAKNPGGLETRFGDFVIAVAKPYDINASGGYAPMLALFGQKDYFLSNIFIPVSFIARASFIPFKWSFGNLGAEISPSWFYISSDQNNVKTSAHLLTVHVGALFQYWLIPKLVSVNARAGIGVGGIFNYHFVYDTGSKGNSMSVAAFSYHLGASVQWLAYKQIFVEGSLDFTQVARKEIPMGFVRFGICGGYQF